MSLPLKTLKNKLFYYIISELFEYYDPNQCKWKIEDQDPCTTESPTTTSTTNAETHHCESLDSRWTCSSGDEKQSLCIKFCSGSYTTEHRKCLCKHSGVFSN